MKTLYYIVALAMLVSTLGLAALHYRYKRPPAPEILARCPKGPSKNIVDEAPRRPRPDPEKVWKNNLFDPLRGRVQKAEGETVDKNLMLGIKEDLLELQGIYMFADQAKAVIIDKNRRRTAPRPALGGPNMPPRGGPPNMPPNRGGPPNAMAGAAAAQETEGPEKRLFGIGEEMPNGLKVKDIAKDTVSLAYLDKEIKLKLKRTDRDSVNRNAQPTVKNQTRIIGETTTGVSSNISPEPANIAPETPSAPSSSVNNRPGLRFNRPGPSGASSSSYSPPEPPNAVDGPPGSAPGQQRTFRRSPF